MRYRSTRSGKEAGVREVLLGGLAPDGGLYLPADWPRLPDEARRRLAEGATNYAEAMRILVPPFLGDALDRSAFAEVVKAGLARFRHPAIAPLSELGAGLFLLELFHGPTYSFKDYGLQPLGALAAALRGVEQGAAAGPLLILGATSGDTGSAALAAFAGRPGVAIAILHPQGRISEVQRRQMTTIRAANVRNIALEGSFDDCQRLLKRLLARFAAEGRAVMSVNSINWGRILFQSVYHARTAFRLAGLQEGGFKAVRLIVPSGNFGNAFSAILARRMGAPIAGLLLATNRNDALARAFSTGRTRAGAVHRTLSPAMDIQIPSNLERFVHLAGDGDVGDTARRMARLAEEGVLEFPHEWAQRVPLPIRAISVDDDETLAAI
ncbi:MAG: threonine synthase, partial [Alphaproteobacteria bacterium]